MSISDLSKLTLAEQLEYLKNCSREELEKYSLIAIMSVDVIEELKK